MILPLLITALVCLGIVLVLAWYRIGIRSRVLWVSVACFVGGLVIGNVVMGRSVVMTACMVAFALAGLVWSRRGHTGTALHFNGVRIGETRGLTRVRAIDDVRKGQMVGVVIDGPPLNFKADEHGNFDANEIAEACRVHRITKNDNGTIATVEPMWPGDAA
jgi:hypothetical protein